MYISLRRQRDYKGISGLPHHKAWKEATSKSGRNIIQKIKELLNEAKKGKGSDIMNKEITDKEVNKGNIW